MHLPFLDIFWGIGIGVVISLPLGPVALITMKRTAEHGLRAGIISGLAIALIDTAVTIFILIGLHHSQRSFYHIPFWLFLIGTIIVFFYGLRMLFADPLKTIERDLPWHKHFFGSFILALTNPSTYLAFGVIGLFLTRFIDRPFFTRAQVAVGFFIGAFLWWSFLAFIAFTQRKRYEKAVFLNKIIGIIIMVLAVLALVHNMTSPHCPIFHTYTAMMSHKKIHRFLVATLPNISIGETITITDERVAHQVHRVLKIKNGESLIVFVDGGKNVVTELIDSSGKTLAVKIISLEEAPISPRTVIAAVSIVKGDAFELMVQKLTEIGVSTIVPLISGRTIKQQVRIDRLQTISDEALEQSGGTKRVQIVEPLSLPECLARYPFQSIVLNPITETTSLERYEDTMVCYVGPEGGWNEQDEEVLRAAKCQPLQITTRVLRTETAAILGAYALLWSH